MEKEAVNIIVHKLLKICVIIQIFQLLTIYNNSSIILPNM